MFQENVEEEYIITQTGTSEGTQVKYRKGGYWYKKDSRGKEGLAEYLVSKLLTFSDLEPEDHFPAPMRKCLVFLGKGLRWIVRKPAGGWL